MADLINPDKTGRATTTTVDIAGTLYYYNEEFDNGYWRGALLDANTDAFVTWLVPPGHAITAGAPAWRDSYGFLAVGGSRVATKTVDPEGASSIVVTSVPDGAQQVIAIDAEVSWHGGLHAEDDDDLAWIMDLQGEAGFFRSYDATAGTVVEQATWLTEENDLNEYMAIPGRQGRIFRIRKSQEIWG